MHSGPDSGRRAVGDALDGANAAADGHARAAKSPAARAVQVVELPQPARGQGNAYIAAATAARPAAGASARMCERGGRGAIVLGRAAAGSLAGGAQAAQKHRAEAAAEAQGARPDPASASTEAPPALPHITTRVSTSSCR
jgi:hypothetical protein